MTLVQTQPNKSIVILHLSDLHFDGDEGDQSSVDRKGVFNSLMDKIKALGEQWKPNVICITGDVASLNQQAGYDKAREWLNKLLNEFQIEKEGVFVCPGNHDVDQKKASFLVRPHNADEADRVLRLPIAEHYKTLFTRYEEFCKAMQFSPYIINGEPEYIVGIREHKGINYVCNNSCWCSMDNNDKGRLWVGQKFIKSLNLPLIESVDLPITIALLHHPREYYHENEISRYGNRDATIDYLASRCHIILTGHGHSRPRKPDTIHDSAIMFSGGCYVSDQYCNSCSLIRLWPEKLCIDYQQCEWDGGQSAWTIFFNASNYKLRIKEKHDNPDYQLAQGLRERTQKDFEKIYDIIYEHVNSLDYAKAINIYEENQEVISRYTDKYKTIIDKIEILISEAKNE